MTSQEVKQALNTTQQYNIATINGYAFITADDFRIEESQYTSTDKLFFYRKCSDNINRFSGSIDLSVIASVEIINGVIHITTV